MPDVPVQVRIGMRVQFEPGHWFQFRGVALYSGHIPLWQRPGPVVHDGLSMKDMQLLAETLGRIERTLNEHCPDLRTHISLEPVT